MKNFISKASKALLVALTTLTISSPAVFAQDVETINLWGEGSDNVKMAWEAIRDAFNESEYGEEYQLEIQWITSGTGAQGLRDRVVAAYLAGETETDYDIIEFGEQGYASYLAELENPEDLFVPLDFAQIPNAENVESELSEGQDFLVPYRGTTVVLAYDSERVENVPTTYDELVQWIKDNPGKFAYNTPSSGGAGGSFVTTAIYNFLPEEALSSSDEAWMEEWDEGFALLEELHPYLYQSGGSTQYPHKNQGTLDLFANQQIDMIPAWADMAISQTTEGRLPETTAITQIDPSFTGNLVVFGMPTIGSQSEGAYAVMNFMLSQEAQQILLDDLAAIPVIDSSNMESANAALLEGLDVSSFRTSSLGELGSELYERWDQEIGTLE